MSHTLFNTCYLYLPISCHIENSVKLSQLSKKLAMHIVASKPQYLDKQQVSPEVLNQELAIIKELTLKEANGKTQKEQILDKIIAGNIKIIIFTVISE